MVVHVKRGTAIFCFIENFVSVFLFREVCKKTVKNVIKILTTSKK